VVSSFEPYWLILPNLTPFAKGVSRYNVLRAFKTELDLNNAQKTACARHAGAARYAYNFGLVRKQPVNDN